MSTPTIRPVPLAFTDPEVIAFLRDVATRIYLPQQLHGDVMIDGTLTAAAINVAQLSELTDDAGIIVAGTLRDADSKFQIDLDDAILTVADDQATPITRVRLGKLDVGLDDYGIEIYDSAGDLILGADGLGVDVVGTLQLLNDAVTTLKIGDLQVTTAKVADLNVTTAKIGDLQVTTGKIDDLAVTTAKIENLNVTEGKIASLAVTTGKIDDLAVTNAKIDDLAVTNAKVNDLAVNKLTAGSIAVGEFIESDNYVAGSVGWRIDDDSAEFNDVTIRGTLDGADGTFAGTLSAVDGTFEGTLDAVGGTFGTITAGLLNNLATDPTAGIRLDPASTKPVTWDRYVDLAATGVEPFLKHGSLELGATGGDLYIAGAQRVAIGTIGTPGTVTKTVRVSAAEMVPRSDSIQFNYALVGVCNVSTSVKAELYGALLLPVGATLTAIRARLRKQNIGGLCQLHLERSDDSENLTLLDTLAFSTTGSYHTVSAVLDEAITGTALYFIYVELLDSIADGARFLWFEYDYTVPDYLTAI